MLPKERFYYSIFWLATVFSVFLLIGIPALLLSVGHAAITWQFLTQAWQPQDIAQGGIRDCILGSLAVGIGVIVVSFPLATATAIYLTEYNQSMAWRRLIEIAIRNLAGVPSIVYGLFGLGLFVEFLHFGMSLLSAILTLSLTTLPLMITGSVKALEAVPEQYREASLALGATHFQTVRKVVFPAALSGCITGGILGIARAMGETAPIILVGASFYLSQQPRSLLDPFMALPYTIFILATQHPSPFAMTFAAGASVILIALTFLLSLAAMLLRFRYRSRRD